MPTEAPLPRLADPASARRSKRRWCTDVIAGLILVGISVAIYAPNLQAGFLTWDDDLMVLANPLVLSPNGLSAIWSRTAHTHGWPNYPLFYTSLWLNHRLWGLEPAAYHAANIALHVLNAVLVLAVLRRLGLGRVAAWLCAAAFALHPLQVESVAWVTERKNVLSGMFYLLALLLYVHHRRSGRWWAYGVAFVAFVAALLSKTGTLTLIPTLLIADWLVLRGTKDTARRTLSASLLRVAPFVIAGVIAAIVLVGIEQPPQEPVPPMLRPLLAARALWFYLGKLLVPVGLCPIYPRWTVSGTTPLAWLPLLGCVSALAAAIRWRAHLGGLVLWGLGHFVVTLLPVIGLVSFAYHDHSFVADRFVYLACIGVFAAMAAAMERVLAALRASRAVRLSVGGAALAAVLALAAFTSRQIPVWHDSYRFWSTAVAANPESFWAQHAFAIQLWQRGRTAEALECWRRSAALSPDFVHARMMIGLMLKEMGDLDAAGTQLSQAVGRVPGYPPLRAVLADVRAAQGQWAEALQTLREIVAADPNCATAWERLAWILATSPDAQWRRANEAVRAAQQAARLTRNQAAQPLDTLGAAYAEAGLLDKAIDAAEHALQLARRDGDEYLAAQIEARLAGYRAGRPFRTPPPMLQP